MNYKQALKIATEAHKGQKRWNGDDYITHPIRVASKFGNKDLKCIAILHDVIEDTDVTLDDLIDKYNHSYVIITIVDVLTHKKTDTYTQYIKKIKEFPMAVAVKSIDLNDNLSDLPKGQRRDKYELALLYLSD